MSSAARVTKSPPASPQVVIDRPLRRFTVAEYHRLGEVGILGKRDRCELIHGLIVERPTINPPHASALTKLTRRLYRLLGDDRVIRTQLPITLSDSEPEPDVVVATGAEGDYDGTHPGAKQVLLVVEVSDSNLRVDQTTMLQLYAAAKIAVYWVVNIPDRRVEVYADPRGGKSPTYRTRTDYNPGDAVPVVVGGKQVGTVPVAELLP